MLRPQKKISKREMKEDRLVTTYFEAQSWFELHRKRVSTVFFSVLVAGIAVWFYFNNLSTQNLAATSDLGKIMRYYDGGMYEVAINGSPQENVRGLQQIVDEYGGTRAGKLAAFYLGNAYFALQNHEKALAAYEEAGADDDAIQAAILAGKGACYEAMGRYADAGDLFEKAAQEDDRKFHSAEHLYHAGQNYLLSGNAEKAGNVLRKLKSGFPDSPYAREADRLLVRVPS